MNISGWDWVAAYAALVSTGALALEVRRWFESGVRLRLSQMSPALVVGDPLVPKDARYLAVFVSNYGDRATTIENLGLLEFKGAFWWWKRLRNKPTKSGITPNPALPGRQPVLPALLEPGQRWQGHIDWIAVKQWLDECDGKLWVAVWYSSRTRPVMMRVRSSKD
ncbi:hypothetical protein SAMN05428982_1929 [Pseudoxanthomonas sp. CF385]|uniref:hypothetical protein n=1 Tax=Pseudoxanthomonas sp. CF385 TaxID=1881042 RepID=UPI000888D2DC|nr:hypothetical protein [Pseudoxanthomonas sp. CF385]SDQ64134.1 hypothetical protein SAMN05428982_1929 [Pseudoxanthomonas sp. CF385]